MYFFGLGKGHLPKKYDKQARKLGAYLVNYTDAGCNCGCGCRPHSCLQSRRHWFETRNYGFPHDKEKATEVLAALGLIETHNP